MTNPTPNQLQCHSCSEKFTPKGDWWEKQDSGYSIQDKTKLWFELDIMEQEDLIKLTNYKLWMEH